MSTDRSLLNIELRYAFGTEQQYIILNLDMTINAFKTRCRVELNVRKNGRGSCKNRFDGLYYYVNDNNFFFLYSFHNFSEDRRQKNSN